MEIICTGNFAGVDSKICLESNYSLLSVSQWTKANDGVMIFAEFGAFGVQNCEVLKGFRKVIKEHSFHKRQLLPTATISLKSLYEIITPHKPIVYIHTLSFTRTHITWSTEGACCSTREANWSRQV